MITLQQVLLLEEKVESAVAKIAQLNAENAALRSKCAELTNALVAKTEQFSSFQNDQNKIEEGILKALNRLDVVENEVLKNAVLSSSGSAQAQVQNNPVTIEPEINTNPNLTFDNAEPVSKPVQAEVLEDAAVNQNPTINNQEEVSVEDNVSASIQPDNQEVSVQKSVEEASSQAQLPFDIF